MSDGFEYRTVLSEKECISRLNGFLSAVKEDYSFLWEGNPSLISKYGTYNIFNLSIDSGKPLSINMNLADGLNKGFKFIGIIRKDNEFNFYLEKFLGKEFILCDGNKVYSLLTKQFDLSTKSCMDWWAKSISKEIKNILEKNMTEKIDGLTKKLGI